MDKALVVGVTGMVGLNLASALTSGDEWAVYGISRRSRDFLPAGVQHVPLDLLNEEDCVEKLSPLKDVTHVFYTIWIKGKDEEENIALNSCIMKNLVNHLPCISKIKQFVLVTGTKHYMGPFSAFSKMGLGGMMVPFKETLPRLPHPNFYYDLEDVVFSAALEYKFTWSVARPAMIIGFAPDNQMNMMTSVAVYASMCKYRSLPFVFPGCPQSLDIILDCIDAKLLAEHLIWETKCPDAGNEAFNVANGDVFVWRHLWKEIADYFGIPVAEYPGHATKIGTLMDSQEEAWSEIVEHHQLKKYKMSELASWWMVEASLGKTASCVTDMSKSRELGFVRYETTPKCIFRLFDHLKEMKFIPF